MATVYYGVGANTWSVESLQPGSGGIAGSSPPNVGDTAIFGEVPIGVLEDDTVLGTTTSLQSSGSVGTDFGEVASLEFNSDGPWTLVGDHKIDDSLSATSLTVDGAVTTPEIDLGSVVVNGSLTVNGPPQPFGIGLTEIGADAITIGPSGTFSAEGGNTLGQIEFVDEVTPVTFAGVGGTLNVGGENTTRLDVSNFQPGDVIDFQDEQGVTLAVNQDPSGNPIPAGSVELFTGNTFLTQVNFLGGSVPDGLAVIPDSSGKGSELVAGSVPIPPPSPPPPPVTIPVTSTPVSSSSPTLPGSLVSVPPDNGNTPTPLTTGQADFVDGLATVPEIGPLLGAVALTFINGFQLGTDLVNLGNALANGQDTQPFYNQGFTDLGNVIYDVLGGALLKEFPNLPSLPSASTNGIQAAVITATQGLGSFLDVFTTGAANAAAALTSSGQAIQGRVQAGEQSFLKSLPSGITVPGDSTF